MEHNPKAAAETPQRRPRVVLVAYHYPPDPAVGSLRARNVAQALAATGHEVHVVSATVAGTPASTSDGPVEVVRVTLGRSPRDILALAKKLVSRPRRRPSEPDAKNAQTAGSAWKGPARVSTVRRWVGAMTWLPDDRQGFIIPAARAAAKLLRRDGDDLLYTTAPPFSDFFVGLLLRTRRRFRWILDFRDPWTDGEKPWFVRTRLTDFIERWAERRSVLVSDGVVTVTNAVADALVARLGERVARKLLVVRNGIPRFFSDEPSSDPTVFRIVYAGSFYQGRDPKPFFAALAAVRGRQSASARRIDVKLIGDCRFFNGESLAPEIERLGLSECVTFVDWLPHAESLSLMRSADLLFLLAQRQPLSVPNKLYEYLGIGKPMLAVVDEHGETARLLREIGGHFVIGEHDKQDDLERALADAMAAAPGSTSPSPALMAMATDAQMRLLTDWLDRLPSRGR